MKRARAQGSEQLVWVAPPTLSPTLRFPHSIMSTMNKSQEVFNEVSTGTVPKSLAEFKKICTDKYTKWYADPKNTPPAAMRAGPGLDANVDRVWHMSTAGNTNKEIKDALKIPGYNNNMTEVMIVRQQKLLGLCDCNGAANGAGGHDGRARNCQGCKTGACQAATLARLQPFIA